MTLERYRITGNVLRNRSYRCETRKGRVEVLLTQMSEKLSVVARKGKSESAKCLHFKDKL
jgi:hypothetical protein